MSTPNDSLTTSGWRAATASRRGSGHRGSSPNQDAVRTELVLDADERPVWLAAVSDGHGGSRYVRSDVGARAAVDVAIEHLAPLVARADTDSDLAALLRREVPALVDAWRRRVDEDHAAHPFTREESTRAGDDDLARYPALAYGATLIVALVGEHGVGVAQIGDGDVLIRAHGFATRPVPGDPRLVAGETTSLCLATAAGDFRFASLPGSAEPDLVMLATDGYGNSFADADWWHAIVGDVADFVIEHGFDELEARFPSWLEESALVGGDDVSGVLIVREPLTVTSGMTGPAPEPPMSAVRPVVATAPQPPPPPPRTLPLPEQPAEIVPRQRRTPVAALTPVLVVLLVVLLVVGTVAVLLASRDDGSPGEPGPGITQTPDPTPREPSPEGRDGSGDREADEPGRPPAGDDSDPVRLGGEEAEPRREGGVIDREAP